MLIKSKKDHFHNNIYPEKSMNGNMWEIFHSFIIHIEIHTNDFNKDSICENTPSQSTCIKNSENVLKKGFAQEWILIAEMQVFHILL